MSVPHDEDRPDPRPALPVEVDIIVNPDGSVTFADLETRTIPIARELNPDQPLVCDVPVPQRAPEDQTAEKDPDV